MGKNTTSVPNVFPKTQFLERRPSEGLRSSSERSPFLLGKVSFNFRLVLSVCSHLFLVFVFFAAIVN
jgi:hypothetical protein